MTTPPTASKHPSRVPPRARAELDYVTNAELGELLGVTAQTLWRWRRAGMPYRQPSPGAKLRYSPAEVDEWLRRREGAA